MATENSGQTKTRRKRTPLQALVDIALAIYALALAVLWLTNIVGPERWWLGVVNLYAPQWVYLVPAVPLALLVLAAHRRRWYVPLLLALFVAGPLMGLRFRWFSPQPAPGQRHLRVMTWNVKWSQAKVDGVVSEIELHHPDLVVMQDALTAGESLGKALGDDWQVEELGQYVIASRHPITKPEPRWISYPEHNHRAARVEMDLDGRTVVVYSVHFKSPRYSLLRVRSMETDTADAVEDSADTRLDQARLLADNLRGEKAPVILGGDLNAPTQSVVCRTLFGAGVHDAFDEGGRGYGYSYGHNMRRLRQLRHSFIRIDHILPSAQWRVVDCWVGTPDVSDHRPVIADLVLEQD